MLERRVGNLAHKLLAAVYYRWAFGSGSRVERWALPRVRAWERSTMRGDSPFEKPQWEEQFAAGRWDYLAAEEERYRSLAELVARHRPGARVLDVGCGAGPLVPALRAVGIASYLGLDVSEVAVSRARRLEDGRTGFLAADAESWTTDERFDAVIFNESLYYFEDPLGGARRYGEFLRRPTVERPAGLLFLSMFCSRRSLAILRQLERRFRTQESRELLGERGGWRQVVLEPLP